MGHRVKGPTSRKRREKWGTPDSNHPPDVGPRLRALVAERYQVYSPVRRRHGYLISQGPLWSWQLQFLAWINQVRVPDNSFVFTIDPWPALFPVCRLRDFSEA